MADCKCAETQKCKCEDATKEKKGLTNTQKWLAIIGLTLVTYYVIIKVNKN